MKIGKTTKKIKENNHAHIQVSFQPQHELRELQSQANEEKQPAKRPSGSRFSSHCDT
jgi:hypothetical protein